VDDVPIRSDVINLRGRPVLGARVRVGELDDASQGQTCLPAWKGLKGDLKTDKDGRVVLRGIGRNRSVWLHVSGPTIEHRLIQPSTPEVVNCKPVDHTDVEIVAGPSKPIERVICAVDAGKPLART